MDKFIKPVKTVFRYSAVYYALAVIITAVAVDEKENLLKQTYYRRGMYLSQVSSNPKAGILFYDLATRYNPEDAQLFYEQGIAYYRLKDQAKALKSIKKAVELDPGNKVYREALETINGAPGRN